LRHGVLHSLFQIAPYLPSSSKVSYVSPSHTDLVINETYLPLRFRFHLPLSFCCKCVLSRARLHSGRARSYLFSFLRVFYHDLCNHASGVEQGLFLPPDFASDSLLLRYKKYHIFDTLTANVRTRGGVEGTGKRRDKAPNIKYLGHESTY